MKVMMINSLDGLRGRRGNSLSLGALDTSTYNQALNAFEKAVLPMVRVHERFQTAANRAQLPADVADSIEQQYRDLQDRITAHATALAEQVNTPTELAAWYQQAENLTDAVEAWAVRANDAVGYNPTPRYLLLGALAIVVFGGAALYIGKKGTMGRGRRRRRRRRR